MARSSRWVGSALVVIVIASVVPAPAGAATVYEGSGLFTVHGNGGGVTDPVTKAPLVPHQPFTCTEPVTLVLREAGDEEWRLEVASDPIMPTSRGLERCAIWNVECASMIVVGAPARGFEGACSTTPTAAAGYVSNLAVRIGPVGPQTVVNMSASGPLLDSNAFWDGIVAFAGAACAPGDGHLDCTTDDRAATSEGASVQARGAGIVGECVFVGSRTISAATQTWAVGPCAYTIVEDNTGEELLCAGAELFRPPNPNEPEAFLCYGVTEQPGERCLVIWPQVQDLDGERSGPRSAICVESSALP